MMAILEAWMANLDQLMQVLALVALLLYLMPRLIGGRVGAVLPRIGAAMLTAAFIIALIQSYFWFSK